MVGQLYRDSGRDHIMHTIGTDGATAALDAGSTGDVSVAAELESATDVSRDADERKRAVTVDTLHRRAGLHPFCAFLRPLSRGPWDESRRLAFECCTRSGRV